MNLPGLVHIFCACGCKITSNNVRLVTRCSQQQGGSSCFGKLATVQLPRWLHGTVNDCWFWAAGPVVGHPEACLPNLGIADSASTDIELAEY